jgi:hypothetical protein
MAFAVAKFWGLMPHVVWHYPFRYYRELRDFYIASLPSAPRVTLSDSDDEVGVTVID